jgi:hypothetical protein
MTTATKEQRVSLRHRSGGDIEGKSFTLSDGTSRTADGTGTIRNVPATDVPVMTTCWGWSVVPAEMKKRHPGPMPSMSEPVDVRDVDPSPAARYGDERVSAQHVSRSAAAGKIFRLRSGAHRVADADGVIHDVSLDEVCSMEHFRVVEPEAKPA